MSSSLTEKVSMIFSEWWHTDNEETFQKAARELVEHGYSENDAVEFLEMIAGAVKSEYGE